LSLVQTRQALSKPILIAHVALVEQETPPQHSVAIVPIPGKIDSADAIGDPSMKVQTQVGYGVTIAANVQRSRKIEYAVTFSITAGGER